MSFEFLEWGATGWEPLTCELEKPYMHKLDQFLCNQTSAIYPPRKDVFGAFEHTALDDVKVVILGQDPYYREGQATGLAFAVHESKKVPGSLRGIRDEIKSNPGGPSTTSSDLESWAGQGVLLLNCFLTVRSGEPKSHRVNGWWARFTDQALELVSYRRPDAVFCLWGSEAKRKRRLLMDSRFDDTRDERILEAGHPSRPSATGFAGCGHFAEVNRLLKVRGLAPIVW